MPSSVHANRSASSPSPSSALASEPATRARLLLASVALGVAAGSRSTLAVVAPVLAGQQRVLVRAAAGLAVVGELIGDKLPSTPSRLQLWQGRVAAGGVGAALLARRAQAPLLLPVAAGLAGAAAGTWGGAAWRAWADQRLPGAAAAILEDGLALTLARWSVSVR